MSHNKNQFVYWVKEREAIRVRKEAGLPKPWSDNKVMQETYFCNIDREDDKVTRWIRDNWQYKEGYKKYFTVAITAARLFNLPEFLEEITQPVDSDNEEKISFWFEHIMNIAYKRKKEGKKCWNGAYIVSTNGVKCDKDVYCVGILDEALLRMEKIDSCITLKDTHKELMGVHGIASFMAGQIVADLKNSVGHPIYTAEDWGTFSAPGPGSLRGLSWYFEEKVTAKTYRDRIGEVYADIELELSEETMSKLCMQNLQNCLCEYDKFMRVTTGVGRSKRKYKGA